MTEVEGAQLEPQSHGPSAHGGDCSCVRCTGFEPGNSHAVGNRGGSGRPPSHGSYAILQLTPRAGEIADWIRSLADHLTPADEPALQTLALTLAQLERAAGVLGEVDEAIERGDSSPRQLDRNLTRIERRSRLSQDSRRWAEAARRLMNDLGLTPHGRAALDERTLTVIHVSEVQAGMSMWAQVCGEFVPVHRRQEFLAAIRNAQDELARRGMPLELSAVDEEQP